MNFFKKIAIIGSCITIILCWPLIIGQLGEQLITQVIAKTKPSNVSVQLVEYKRGYLSSDILIKIDTLDDTLKLLLEEIELPTSFYMQGQVHHKLARLDTDLVIQDTQITANIITSLKGESNFTFKTANINYEKKADDFILNLEPIVIIGSANQNDEIYVKASIKNAKAKFTQGENITLDNLTLTFDKQAPSMDINSSQNDLAIKSEAINKINFAVNNVVLNLDLGCAILKWDLTQHNIDHDLSTILGIFKFFDTIDGNIYINLNEQLATSFNLHKSLKKMLKIDIISKQDNNYIFDVQLDNGNLILPNGKTMPISALSLLLY